jgi:hypothetical protein
MFKAVLYWNIFNRTFDSLLLVYLTNTHGSCCPYLAKNPLNKGNMESGNAGAEILKSFIKHE